MAQHWLVLKLSTFWTQAWNVTSTQNRAQSEYGAISCKAWIQV